MPPFIQLGDWFIHISAILYADYSHPDHATLVFHGPEGDWVTLTFEQRKPEYWALRTWLKQQSHILLSGKHEQGWGEKS